MERIKVLLMLFLLVLSSREGMVPTASAAPPGRLISSPSPPAKSYAKYADIVLNPKELKGFVSDAFAALLKWIWAFPATTKNGRAVLQFESGYTVETVFDGSKHGIEPYSLQVSPDGDLLVLDSENSNILRVTPPLSRYSRAKVLAGSADGYAGYVDAKPREARLNHPKGFTVDDKGNVYVADTMNMAIRKIGEAGVTTIAGGRSSKPGHIDGPSEDAKFSNDFDVVYVGSTCSLLVVDRGNHAIREIQLNYEDCAYQYGSNFSSGVVLMGGAALMGYVLALFQQGVITAIFSRRENQDKLANSKKLHGSSKSGDRPSLIPIDGDQENVDAGWVSFGKFFVDVFKSAGEIIGGLFSYVTGGFRRKSPRKKGDLWPLRDSLIPEEDDVEPQLTPRRKRSVTFREPEVDTPMSPPSSSESRSGDDPPTREYMNRFTFNGSFNNRREYYEDEGHMKPLRHHASTPETYFEGNYDSSNEVVFGAVQETGDVNEPVEIKPVDYGDPMYDHHNIRSRMGMGQYYDY